MSKHMAEQKDPSLFDIVLSVLASFFGVQSSRNAARDYAYIDKIGLKPYVIVAVILTVGFVLLVAGVVNIVLSNVA